MVRATFFDKVLRNDHLFFKDLTAPMVLKVFRGRCWTCSSRCRFVSGKSSEGGQVKLHENRHLLNDQTDGPADQWSKSRVQGPSTLLP